jgi:asparagine synthase (glutamine-hydrolysing)
MCGIAGVLMRDQQGTPSAEGVRRMSRVLGHRGPDAEGFWAQGPASLAHRRLSIIDLASGHQPMSSADGMVHLVFNGEIYNFQELRSELEQAGHRFRTHSDTEVLLALYLQHGLDTFPRLNGMFACAFWDQRSDRLIMARDRFGKKPLFYHIDSRRALFGSELKSLLAYGDLTPHINHAALHEYLTHSYIVGEDTILTGVKRLPPAHLLVLEADRVICRPYWTFRFQPAAAPPAEEEVLERVESLLRHAVKRRTIADVPLGAFLSGGLDSSLVVAMMTQLSDRPVRTFTVGFEESGYSEIEDARIVAKQLGTDHQEIIVKPSGLDVLPKVVWHLDEPFGDSSAIPTYYVCEAARRHVTVAISGDGGDEVFAGYTRYLRLDEHLRMSLVPAWFRRDVVGPLVSALPFTAPGWNYLHALSRHREGTLPLNLGIYPFIQQQLYSQDFARSVAGSDAMRRSRMLQQEAAGLDPVSRYQYVDTLDYLPSDILTKVDRMSMANSLEVRSPLLDHTLVEYAATLPVSLKIRNGLGKYLLRKLVAKWLPPSLLSKPKQGFALPKDRWFRQDHRQAVQEILLDPRTLQRGYFRPETVRRLLAHHGSGRRDYSVWIWCLLVLELWFRQFIDQAFVLDRVRPAGRATDRAA